MLELNHNHCCDDERKNEPNYVFCSIKMSYITNTLQKINVQSGSAGMTGRGERRGGELHWARTAPKKQCVEFTWFKKSITWTHSLANVRKVKDNNGADVICCCCRNETKISERLVSQEKDILLWGDHFLWPLRCLERFYMTAVICSIYVEPTHLNRVNSKHYFFQCPLFSVAQSVLGRWLEWCITSRTVASCPFTSGCQWSQGPPVQSWGHPGWPAGSPGHGPWGESQSPLFRAFLSRLGVSLWGDRVQGARGWPGGGRGRLPEAPRSKNSDCHRERPSAAHTAHAHFGQWPPSLLLRSPAGCSPAPHTAWEQKEKRRRHMSTRHTKAKGNNLSAIFKSFDFYTDS